MRAIMALPSRSLGLFCSVYGSWRCAQSCKESRSGHHKAHMAVPAVPGSGPRSSLARRKHSSMVQPRGGGHLGQCGVGAGMHEVTGQLFRVPQAPAGQEPAGKAFVCRLVQWSVRPVRKPLAPGSFARAEGLPGLGRKLCNHAHGVGLNQLPFLEKPQRMVRAHGQNVSLPARLQHTPEPGIRAANRIGQNEGARRALVQQFRNHFSRHRRLCGKGDVLRYGRLGAAGRILGPRLRQIQLPFDQRMSPAAGIACEDADLAISRSGLPCRNIAAPHRPNACPFSRSQSHQR